MVQFVDGRAIVLGSARRVNVRKGTPDYLPGRWPGLEAILETAPRTDGRDAATIEVSALQGLGVEITPQADVQAILLPDLHEGSVGWHRVTSELELRSAVIDQVCVPPSALNAFLVQLVERPSIASTLSLVEKLCQIPTFVLKGDLSSGVADAQLDELLDAALPVKAWC
ncbi:hypothetical protein [Promicromonospora sp. NPDC057488]|uniref:hypothetical protein n=1 Tax=Promicromonospora sp. NPDC057488 TaxID=3346147 RepID=UPI003671BABA